MPKHLFVTEKTPLFNDYPVGHRGGSKKSGAGLKVESGICNQQLAISYSQSGIQPVTGGFQQKFCALAGFQDKARAHECPVPHFLHRRIPKPSALRQGGGIIAQNADAMQACRRAASSRRWGVRAQNADAMLACRRAASSRRGGVRAQNTRCNLGAASGQAPERIIQPPERLVFADE